jgi:hypothetical protein
MKTIPSAEKMIKKYEGIVKRHQECLQELIKRYIAGEINDEQWGDVKSYTYDIGHRIRRFIEDEPCLRKGCIRFTPNCGISAEEQERFKKAIKPIPGQIMTIMGQQNLPLNKKLK